MPFGRRLAVPINTLLTVLTLSGNGLVLLAFYKVRSLRTPANFLLISLSVADMFFGVLFVLKIITFAAPDQALPCLCHIFQGRVGFALNSIVLLHLAAISIERLVAIKFPLRYVELVTKRRVRIAIAIVWILGVVLNVLLPVLKVLSIILSDEEKGERLDDLLLGNHPEKMQMSYNKFFNCTAERSLNNINDTDSWQKRPHIYIKLSTLFLPYAIIFVCHAWIFKISWQQYKRLKEQLESICPEMRLQMKFAKTTAIVMGSFMILFTPLLGLAIARFISEKNYDFDTLIIASLVSSNCAWVNPIIYAWRKEDFRKAFYEILKSAKVRLCRGRCQNGSEENPSI